MKPLRTSEGARWDCHQCGFCCRFVTLGPVEPERIQELEEREIHLRWGPAGERPWYEARAASDGSTAYYLSRVDGACIFLDPDNRCAVHALFGPDAKPGFCREFPFAFSEAPEVLHAAVRPDCSGAHLSAREGRPAAERAEEARDLPIARPHRAEEPSSIEILTGFSLDMGAWRALEPGWSAALQGGAPGPAVALLRSELFSLTSSPTPTPDPARYRLAGLASLEGLRQVAEFAARQPAGSPAELAFVHENLERIRRAREGWGPLRPLSDEAAAYLNRLLRDLLLLAPTQAQSGLAAHLGFFLLSAQVAYASGGPSLDPLARSLSRWHRFANNSAVRAVLKLARPALVDLFLNAE